MEKTNSSKSTQREHTDHGGDVEESTTPESKTAGSESDPETIRELKRVNKELLVRIKELQLEIVTATLQEHLPEGEGEADGGGTGEWKTVIDTLREMQDEIDASRELKKALQDDLGVTRERLVEQESRTKQLEARAELLEVKSSLAEQLREEVAFLEEEKTISTRRIEELVGELKQTTEERDGLVEERSVDAARIQELENTKIDLESQVNGLKGQVADFARVRKELVEVVEARQRLNLTVQNLEHKLKVSEEARDTLEKELVGVRDQLEEMSGQKRVLMELQARLDDRNAQISKLTATIERLENERKALVTQNASMKVELDANKKYLGEIRTAALQTRSHIRKLSARDQEK